MAATPDGPRIAPLPPDRWPPEMKDALAALRPANVRHPFPQREGRPKGLNVLGTLAQHPELTKAFNTFNGYILFASTLEPRQRELLVLRVAHVRGADYEWAQHVVIGRDVGLTDDEIDRITVGPAEPGWGPLDRALLQAVDELVRDAFIADSTWSALAAELDQRQLMDVVFTVGTYELLAMAFNSFGLVLDDDLRPASQAEMGFS